jgi:hypothetical protein
MNTAITEESLPSLDGHDNIILFFDIVAGGPMSAIIFFFCFLEYDTVSTFSTADIIRKGYLGATDSK